MNPHRKIGAIVASLIVGLTGSSIVYHEVVTGGGVRPSPPNAQTATTFPNYTGGTCSSAPYTLSTAGASQDFGNNWQVGNQSQGGAGTSVMSVCSPASWYDTINQPEGSPAGVEWYNYSGLYDGAAPAINNTAGIPLNEFHSISSTYGSAITGQCDCESAYDIWFNNLCETATAQGPPYDAPWSTPPHDTMIWNQWGSFGNGMDNFSGDDAQASWAKEIETSGTAVTLGGVAYHWMTQNGLGDEKIFVQDTPTATGTVNILAILNYLAGQTATSEISPTSCLSVIEYGFEVDGTNGSARLDVNNLQITTS